MSHFFQKFFLAMGLTTRLGHLGPHRLPRTVTHLLICGGALVSSLYLWDDSALSSLYLWDDEHPQAIELQQIEATLNNLKLAYARYACYVMPVEARVSPCVRQLAGSACQDCDRDTPEAMRFSAHPGTYTQARTHTVSPNVLNHSHTHTDEAVALKCSAAARYGARLCVCVSRLRVACT